MSAAIAMTDTQRRAAIGLKLAMLQRRMPNGWEGWSTAQLLDFRADLRTSKTNCSMSDLLRVAGRIAQVYGEHMAMIDPCHGQSA